MFKHIYLLAFLGALLIAVVCWSQTTSGQIGADQRSSISAQMLGFGG